MGYYPPLTDYLADWRMDQIKGEDLQDPTARQQISALSTSVNTLSQQVTTLSVSVANKVSKSGDTMTGDLTMGLLSTTESRALRFQDSLYSMGIKLDDSFLTVFGSDGICYRFRDDGYYSEKEDVVRVNLFTGCWRVYQLNGIELDSLVAAGEILVNNFTQGVYDWGTGSGTHLSFEPDSQSPESGTYTFTTPYGETITSAVEDEIAKFLIFSDSAGRTYVLVRFANGVVLPNDLPIFIPGAYDSTTQTFDFLGRNDGGTFFQYVVDLALTNHLIVMRALFGEEVFELLLEKGDMSNNQTQLMFTGVVKTAFFNSSGTAEVIVLSIVWSPNGSCEVTHLSMLDKSGDTMTGSLVMGGRAIGSNSIYFPEGSSSPSSANYTGFEIFNNAGFLEVSYKYNGSNNNNYYRFNGGGYSSTPEDIMTARYFVGTWRGAAFINGDLALKFQMEESLNGPGYLNYEILGPDSDNNPVQRLSWDNDQSFWQLTTTMGTFQLAGSTSDTFLTFGATVQGVRYDVFLFKNVGNAIVLPTDIPLIVNATIDTQTGEIDFSEVWRPIEWMVKMGRIIHLRAIINSETFEIPLTNCTQTQLRFSGVVYSTTLGVTYAPYQITVVWSEDGTADDFIYFPLADRYELNTLSKGYPVVVPTKSISSGTDAVAATNRAVTSLSYVAADSVTAVNLTFPSINSGFSRDFILYIDFAPNNLVVNLPVSGVTFIVPEGENLSDMTSIDSGAAANIYFSEVKANTFAVHRVTFEAAV